jgi:hypothetical protein
MGGDSARRRFPSADELARWLRPSNVSDVASRRQQAAAQVARENPELARAWVNGLLNDRRFSVSSWALDLGTEIYGKDIVGNLIDMLRRRGEIQTEVLATLRQLNADALTPYLPRIRRWLRRSYGHPFQYLPILYVVTQLRDTAAGDELRALRAREDVMPLIRNVADFGLAYIENGPRGLAEAVRDCTDDDRLYGAKYLVAVGGLPKEQMEDALREVADKTTGDSRERCLQLVRVSQRNTPFDEASP